ncbi:MAG TPA: anti-sigma factor [Acidimicrobiales bacterium]|nr:anti-sigma factor [Acidimicrobiales bacterium]
MSLPGGDHDEMRDLVAAYALDAVDDADRDAVERHVETCPRCRAELAAHQETAALLAFSGGQAPGEVWERIADAIGAPGSPPPALELVTARPRRVRRRWVAAVGAVAAGAVAAAVALLGLTVSHQSARIDDLAAAAGNQATLRQAVTAALQPGARNQPLVSPSGTVLGDVVLGAEGGGYVIADRFRTLPADRTYQLWAIVDGTPVSLGLLGPDPTVLVFRPAPGASELAVTAEQRGGALRPSGAPVAAASI